MYIISIYPCFTEFLFKLDISTLTVMAWWRKGGFDLSNRFPTQFIANKHFGTTFDELNTAVEETSHFFTPASKDDVLNGDLPYYVPVYRQSESQVHDSGRSRFVCPEV